MRQRTLGAVIHGGPMRLGAMLLASWLLLALESVAAAHPPIRLDLGALVIVYFALESPPVGGAVASLFVGYLADVFSGESRGLTSAALVITFLVVRLLVVRSSGARWAMVTSVGVVGTVLAFGVRLFIEGVVGPGLATSAAATPAIPWLLAGAVALAYPVYRYLRFVDDRFRQREDEVHYRAMTLRRRR